MSQQTKSAPGTPGMDPKWTSSSKTGIGKALNAGSDVSFTISHGILNEVYYPQEDIACIRDMGLIVTDGTDYFCEEKRHTDHSIQWLKPGIPAYQIKKPTKTKDTELGIYVADLKFSNKKVDKIELTFYWEEADKWEGIIIR
ncbi:MAG TPA: hypothetical protein VK112_10075 [Fodinibius sp.]|nr:hypothetical protein [Fodinibius sp.]